MSALRLVLHAILAIALTAIDLDAHPATAQTVSGTLTAGTQPRAVAVNSVTNTIYVANEFSNNVTVIDGATLATRTVPVGNRPQYIAVNAVTNKVYVSNGGDSTQTVIDGATLRTSQLVTGSNGPIAVNEATSATYVIRLGNADEVTRIRPDNTWHTMAIESYAPVAQVLDARSNKLYVANYATGDVRTVDLNSSSDFPPTKTVAVWGHPVALVLNPNTGMLYVIGEDSRGPINVVDTATNTAVYYAPAGHAVGAKAIGINTVTNKVYAAFAGEVAVIDGATHAMTFLPSGTPVALAVNERTNKIYVATSQGFVTVIDGATNATTRVAIPQNATALALNPLTNKLYVAAGTVTVIDAGPASAAPPAAPGYNVQGLWWRSSEPGWGINFTQQGDTLFSTWFTYDADGSGLWLVMPNGARSTDNSYSGTLYRTTGPAYNAAFSSAPVTSTAAGSATFTFTSPDSGILTATVNGTTLTRPISRELYGAPVPACTLGGAAGAAPNYQDLWWRAGGSESGWGINITHQGEILFLTWFTYDTGGKGLWLVASNVARTGNATYSGTLYRTWGAPFDMQPWSPATVRAMPVGNVSLAFSDAANGTFTATVDGVTVMKPITREVFATPTSVCK
ncbi:MAG: YncE family protein [Usitatibacter sp.]